MIKTIPDNTFLNLLHGKPTTRTPVWIMRQAGRYLPEYRALRAKAGDFLTLCKTPELACEITLQPLNRFRLDAAILFSDILTIPDAMGLGLHFTEGEGPHFKRRLESAADIKALCVPDPHEKLSYVMDAIRLIKQELAIPSEDKDVRSDKSTLGAPGRYSKAPLIGFSGSPWTLACYMIEGGKSQNFHRIKKWLYTEPAILHHLLNTLAQSVIAYLIAQIEAGVDTVMIFDSWGGILSPDIYQHFSLSYIKTIIEALPKHIPVIVYTKNGGVGLELMAQTGCRVIGIDWTITLQEARRRVPETMILQGNWDPAILLSHPTQIEQEVKKICPLSNHIANLGHGITPDIPVENVEAFVEAIHRYSPSI